jgi:hypothetical protein
VKVIEVAAFLNWLLDVYDGDLSQPEPRSRIMNKYEEWQRLREAPSGDGEFGKMYSIRDIAKPRIIPINTKAPREFP